MVSMKPEGHAGYCSSKSAWTKINVRVEMICREHAITVERVFLDVRAVDFDLTPS